MQAFLLFYGKKFFHQNRGGLPWRMPAPLPQAETDSVCCNRHIQKPRRCIPGGALYFILERSILCFLCSRSFCCRGRSCRLCRFSLGSHIVDSPCRTFFRAKSAVLALFRIDESVVVLNCDSFELTYLHALTASDTSVGASLASRSALIFGVALNNNFVLRRSNSDDMLRTSACASSAACAEFSCHNRNAVANLDRVEVTSSGAVPKSKAAVFALVHSAIKGGSRRASGKSLIFHEGFYRLGVSVTHYGSNLGFC